MEIRERLDGVDRKVADIHGEIYGRDANPGLRGRMAKVETVLDLMERRFAEMGDDMDKRFETMEQNQDKRFAEQRRVFIGGVSAILTTVIAAMILAAMSSCREFILPGPTSTPIPTALLSTPTETATSEPTMTPTATALPGSPTPTPIGPVLIPDDAPNRLENPGFEGDYTARVFPEIHVAPGWEPFWCASGYLDYADEDCPNPVWDGNVNTRLYGRPEFKPSDVPNRVFSGQKSQQWFCTFRVCNAGVYQVVDTAPGEVCRAQAYVQTWSAATDWGFDGNGYVQWGSDRATLDQQRNSWWTIRADTGGGVDAFAGHPGQSFGYSFGHYDRFALISYTVMATGDQTTFFFGNVREYGLGHNDSYIGFAEVQCIDPANTPPVPPTPAPSLPPPPTPMPRPYDPAVQVLEPPRTYTATGSQFIREGHTVAARSVGGLSAGQEVSAYAVWSAGSGDLWVCLDEQWTWIANPDYYLYSLVCGRWAAWRYAGSTLGSLTP